MGYIILEEIKIAYTKNGEKRGFMKKEISTVLALLGGIVLGAVGTGYVLNNKLVHQTQMSNKHLSLFLMMNQWVMMKQQNKSIAGYLERYGYNEIAVYGMNYAGQTLVNELKDSNIKIKYGIDNNSSRLRTDMDIEIVTPNEKLPEVDVVIVTAITFFEEIENQLSKKMNCPILSLEDILYEV